MTVFLLMHLVISLPTLGLISAYYSSTTSFVHTLYLSHSFFRSIIIAENGALVVGYRNKCGSLHNMMTSNLSKFDGARYRLSDLPQRKKSRKKLAKIQMVRWIARVIQVIGRHNLSLGYKLQSNALDIVITKKTTPLFLFI